MRKDNDCSKYVVAAGYRTSKLNHKLNEKCSIICCKLNYFRTIPIPNIHDYNALSMFNTTTYLYFLYEWKGCLTRQSKLQFE